LTFDPIGRFIFWIDADAKKTGMLLVEYTLIFIKSFEYFLYDLIGGRTKETQDNESSGYGIKIKLVVNERFTLEIKSGFSILE
jgi:hypothetical protein